MRTLIRSAAVTAALLALLPFTASAEQIDCRYKGMKPFWINRIRIDTVTKVALVDLGPHQAASEPIEGQLIYADEGEISPAYAFNIQAASDPDQLRVLKLFYVQDKWRLIDAGIRYVHDKPALMALGDSVELVCNRQSAN